MYSLVASFDRICWGALYICKELGGRNTAEFDHVFGGVLLLKLA